MSYELITDLCESKVFRSRQAMDRYTESDAKEFFYAYLLSLVALSQEKSTASWASDYAEKTGAFVGFDIFRASATDLYVLTHMVNKTLRSDILKQRFIIILRGITNGTITTTFLNTYLMQVERALSIKSSQLKVVRRSLTQWSSLPKSTRDTYINQLKRIIVSYSRVAEILPQLNKATKSGVSLGTKLAAAGLGGLLIGLQYDPRKRVGFVKSVLGENTMEQYQDIISQLEENPLIDEVEHIEENENGITAIVSTTSGERFQFDLKPIDD